LVERMDALQALRCNSCGMEFELPSSVYRNAEALMIAEQTIGEKHKCPKPVTQPVRIWTPPTPEMVWAKVMQLQI
jgi:hypothetical protein